MTLTGAVDRARASFRAGLSRTGVVGPPRVRNRPRTTTNLPHRLADGTILDEDASENWWATSKNFHFSLFITLFLLYSSVRNFFFFFFYIPIGKNREMACFFFLQMEKWSSWWWRGVAQKPIKKPTKPTQLSTLASLMIRRIVFAPCVRGATTKPGIRYTSDISLTPCPI